ERTRVGALVDPDVERMLSLKPDLAIVYGTQGDLIERLERAGVPMFNYEHAGLTDITATLRALGARVGYAGEADRLAAQIERDIAAIRSRVAGRQRPRTAVIIGREPGSLRGIYASAGIGFLHDMLEAAGGDDVFADVVRQNLQVSVEILLARAPQVIIEVHPPEGWTPERLARERDLWQAFAGLPAVRNARVHLIADDAVLVPGPRVVDGIRRMAEVLHPDAWK
ncbi:MAG TPA: ABC transporter substrate-binding protein, partial [Vicinamibacterales bacterium]|nr:ABC transporter substrate-binding protein [Vicinamibacterales bacterium]